MLDFFTILTKGGLILWCIQNSPRDHLPFVNKLLADVFVEERVTTQKYSHENIQMEYLVNNRWNLIYVVGYYRGFSLAYIRDLLSDADTAFENKLTTNGYKPEHIDFFGEESIDFANDFDIILKYRLQQDSAIHHKPIKKANKETITVVEEIQNGDVESHQAPNAVKTTNLVKNEEKAQVKTINDCRKSNKKVPKAKTARVWDNDFSTRNLADSSLMETLDFSGKKESADSTSVQNVLTERECNALNKDELSKTLYESITAKKSKTQQNKSPKLFDYFKGLVGSREITHDNLETIMTSMKHHLCDKNVASDIADDICVSVTNKLVGKSLGTFELLKNTVKGAMVEAIQKVLIPSNEFDLLTAVDEINKDFHRPYVIVMCGVNGVGKSTNLAKISHYLTINKNYHLMIAACDTFRSGAVEQLRTHVTRLNHIVGQMNGNQNIKNGGNNDQSITLYDKGYNKDASLVAKEAIAQAKKLNKNVVLIDTAGRMQDNEPLMRSLAKLIHMNSPDLVLFVGEALVGNDGVDQLTKFNNSLKEYACNNNPHVIDGIVLTKFDTIDDKVGAAISMTYTSGKPIMFVGIGQTYSDIKKLDVDSVVRLLFQ